MTNYIKRFSILFFIVSSGLFANEGENLKDDIKNEESKDKEVFIEELVEDYEEIPGFFITYRDPKTNKIFLKINQNQLGKEFIYFAHVLDSVVTTGNVRGSYTDKGIFKIEKDFENLRFTRVLTNYVFDEESPLKRSKGANTSDSTFKVDVP